MSNPSDMRQDAEDEHEYDDEEEEYLVEDQEEEDDEGDDLEDIPEVRSCLGAVVAAIAFWLGLALTALCFCAVFAVTLP